MSSQLADIDTPRDRVLCLSAYKDQAIDAGNEDASPQAHEELITENASIIKLFCDAYFISLGKRLPFTPVIVISVIQFSVLLIIY
jgi:hypothetical protein